MAFYGNGSGITELGALVSTQVFTSSGTWTKASGVAKVRVIVTGGGGGASGTPGNNEDDIGGGGSAGGTAIKTIDVTGISTVSVTVGGGGSAPAANSGANGSDGGTSSFGSHCSATGGGGAPSYNSTSNTAAFPSGNGSGGDINIYGGHGHFPDVNDDETQTISGLYGGASYWGGSGRHSMDDNFTGGNHDSTANDQGGWGCGGSGSARGFAGSSGRQGVVVVESYK
tara:strand:+ start:1866 stop:2546 length:681 start_codon:yes stop_codon:yes gene_type:complete